jgi:hypothetical protein
MAGLLRRLRGRAGLLTVPGRGGAAPLPPLPDLRHPIPSAPLNPTTFEQGMRGPPMARFKQDMDRNEAEQGTRVAVDLVLENFGYKEQRLAEVCGRADRAARLRKR